MTVKVEFTALGAGQEVGRSCLLLTIDNVTVMLDCGAHPTRKEDDRVPDMTRVPKDLKAILITHYHLDHAAGLPYVTEIDGNFANVEVIMTLPTKVLAPLVLQDYSRGGNQDLYLPIHIERSFSKARVVHLHERFTLRDVPDMHVTTFYAGHVLGGVMLLIEYKGVSVLYTGDYSAEPDAQLAGAYIPKDLLPSNGVDLIITESTYATAVRTDPKRRALDLCKSVQNCVDAGGIVLLPVFAVGRAQELATLVRSGVKGDYEIYTTNESSLRAFHYSHLFKSWCLNQGEGIVIPSVQLLSDINSLRGPAVVLASPSMLESGSSLSVFNSLCEDSKNLCLLTGYCFPGTVGNRLIYYHSKRTRIGERSVDILGKRKVVSCAVDYIPFTGHTDVVGIKQVLDEVNARNIILVHGENDKMQRLAIDLRKKHAVDVQVPANFETISYSFPGVEQYNLDPDGPSVEELLDMEKTIFTASTVPGTDFIRLS